MHLILAFIAVLSANLSAPGPHYVAVKATSLLYCPQDHRIYATVAPDAKGNLANSVCRIDPDSGRIEASVFVGDDPKGIVRSTDGKSLWVLVAGNKMVRQIDRSTMKAGLTFPVGENQAARQIAPIPDVPDALIVHRYNPSISPQFDNLCVYLGGRQAMDGIPCGSQLSYGIDPARVITSSEGSSSYFYFGVNAALHTEDGPGFFNGVHKSLKASGYGLIFSSDGDVVDPEARQTLGRLLVTSGELCVDPVRPVVYEVYGDHTPMLRCWDPQTFRNLWESPLPTWDGPHHLTSPVRWGANGLAYIDGDYIVSGPCNLGSKSNPVDLSVTRTGFPKEPVDGLSFTYTLTVTNNSDSPSTGAFLTDTIPGIVAVRSTTASQGSVVFSQGVVRADLGSIPARGSANVKVTLDVQNRGTGGYCAVVRSFDPDPDTSNNVYPGPTFVPHAKLALGNPRPGSSFDLSWNSLGRQARGAGDNLTIEIDGEFAVVNNGKSSSAPTSVRFYLQDGPNLVVDWATFLQEEQIPSLAPGERYVVTLAAPFASDTDVVGMYVVANFDPLKANGQTSNVSRQIH